MPREIKKDEWGIVLDFLSRGHYGMRRSEPVAQVIGEKYFSLLEVIVRENTDVKIGERLYIGEGKRDKIKFIKKRLKYNELTGASKSELEATVETIMKANPQTFFNFFNKAGPITTRLHQLELLPGIGKKHLWAIIEERKKSPFKSFEDLKKRIPMIPKPENMILKRILEEIEDKDKYRLFVPKFEKRRKQTYEQI